MEPLLNSKEIHQLGLIGELYYSLFRDLNYSILGYHDIDSIIDKFYNEFAKSDIFKPHTNNSPYYFFMTGFLRFTENKTHEETIKSIREWKVDSFNRFFLKTFNIPNKSFFLEFYFFILYKLKRDYNLKEKNMSHTISHLFGDNINLHVSITNTNSGAIIGYDDDHKLLSIRIPERILCKDFIVKPVALQHLFKKEIKSFQFIEEHSNYYYLKEDPKNIDLKYDELFSGIFNLDELSRYRKECESDLMLYDEQLFYPQPQLNNHVNDFILLTIGYAYLSLYFGANIDHYSSTVYTEFKGNKFYSRNFGGLLVGYNKNYDITSEERVAFKIIIDRISSIISADVFSRSINLSNSMPTNKKWVASPGKDLLPLQTLYMRKKESHSWYDYEKSITSNANELIMCYRKFVNSDFDEIPFKSISEFGLQVYKYDLIGILTVRRAYFYLWLNSRKIQKRIDAPGCSKDNYPKINNYCILRGTSWNSFKNKDAFKIEDSKNILTKEEAAFKNIMKEANTLLYHLCIKEAELTKGIGILEEETQWLSSYNLSF